MMKKISLTLALTAITFSAAFAQTSSTTNSINFKGYVTDSACTVSPIEDVDLGSISVKTLMGGQKGGWGTSEIIFTDCNLDIDGEAKTKIDLSVLAGGAADVAGNYWVNDGNATGVGVEIEIAGKNIKPAGISGTEAISLDILGDTVRTTVRGRTVNAGTGDVTEGTVSARMNFVAEYK